MSTVHDEGLAVDVVNFEATLPGGSCEAFAKVVLIDSIVLLHHQSERHGSHSGVDGLVCTYEWHEEEAVFQSLRHFFALYNDHLTGAVFAAAVDFKISAIEIELALLFVGFLLQFLQRHMLGSGDSGHAFLHDARLLVSDFLQASAQVFLMVHSHVGNDGNHWGDHIGGVVKTAHAHFHDCVVHFHFFEIPEGHSGQEFKFRGRFHAVSDDFLSGFADDGSCLGEVFLRNIAATEVNAFGVVDEVRGNVAAHAKGRILQHAGDHGAYAAFAIGAGDVNHLVCFFRMIQFFQDGFDAFQSRFDTKGRRSFQVCNGFFVIHNVSHCVLLITTEV